MLTGTKACGCATLAVAQTACDIRIRTVPKVSIVAKECLVSEWPSHPTEEQEFQKVVGSEKDLKKH